MVADHVVRRRGEAVGPRAVLRWLALWTALGLAFTVRAHMLMQQNAADTQWSWWRSLASEMPDWYLWGLVSLVVPHIARRFPLEPGHLRRSLPVHAVSGLAITMCYLVGAVLVQAATRTLAGESYALWAHLRSNFVVGYLWNIVVYVAILGFTLTAIYRAEVQAQLMRTAHLETGLAKARLDALSSQLRPHFLFNTLNGVSELIHTDAERAEAMLTGLGDLLRRSLAANGTEIPLRDEMVTVSHYLEIQRNRFADRLDVELDVSPEAAGALVPNLALLPLVENAVVHGAGGRPGAVRLGVCARRAGAELQIEVWDDGAGIAADPPTRGQGLGLANTRERLAAAYGLAASIALESRPAGGATCRLRLPFRTAS
jgi:signal transduction histidine kinase